MRLTSYCISIPKWSNICTQYVKFYLALVEGVQLFVNMIAVICPAINVLAYVPISYIGISRTAPLVKWTVRHFIR